MQGTYAKWLPGTVIRRLGPLTYLVKVGHRLSFVHIDHLLQAHSVADPVLDAEGVEPTLDESTVSQDAAREQTSVFPDKSSQLRLSPENLSQLRVSREKSSQSCLSPEKSSTHTSVQRERRYPTRSCSATTPKYRPTTDQTSPPLPSCFPCTLLLNRCLQMQLLPPHSCPVEQAPSIDSNGTIS